MRLTAPAFRRDRLPARPRPPMMARQRGRLKVHSPVLACALALLLVGACSPAPRERVFRIERLDSLPSAYAAVRDFCSPAADPVVSPPADPPAPPSGSAKVPLGSVVPEQSVRNTGFEYAMRCVVRSQAQLEALWALTEYAVEPPRIRFSEQVLIVSTGGVKGSGGWDIRHEAAWRIGDTVFIRVDEYTPGHGCEATAEETRPAQAVRTHSAPVFRFEEVFHSHSCD